MNTSTNSELAKVAATDVGALALITIDPARYVAEIFNPFRAKLDVLVAAAEAVDVANLDLKTGAGMDVAIKHRAAFRDEVRIAGEKARADRKAPLLSIGKLLDSEYKTLAAAALPHEEKWDKLIKDEESRKEVEKAVKIAAERARVDAIQARINAMRTLPASVFGKSSTEIIATRDVVRDTIIDDVYAEFKDSAMDVRSVAFNDLEVMYEAALESEAAIIAAEQARITEAARIDAERVELARQRAENERIAAELKAQADAQAEVARKEQAERDRVAADVKRQLDEQQAQIAAQSRALAEQQAAADARDAEALRVAKDAQQREDDHCEALAMNAQFDADRAAELARCTETAKAMLTNGRSLAGPAIESLTDAGDDPSDQEIIELVCETFGMSMAQAIERVRVIAFDELLAYAAA